MGYYHCTSSNLQISCLFCLEIGICSRTSLQQLGSISQYAIAGFSSKATRTFPNGSTMVEWAQAWQTVGSSLNCATLTPTAQHWLSSALALKSSSQCKGPVVWLKLPGQSKTEAPFCLINRPSSANLRSQHMARPILQYSVLKTHTLLPWVNVSDSLQVIFPGMSISNRWSLSNCS